MPVFDGQEKKFQSWWVRFQAYAQVKGFHLVLRDPGLTIFKSEMEGLEMKKSPGSGGSNEWTTDEEKQYRLGKKIFLAMTHLTMAFGSKGLLNKIASACTTDWPGGEAHKLVSLLKEKCAPRDQMATVERTRKLNSIRLKKGENLAKLCEQLKAIDNQFSDLTHRLSEDDKIANVLEKASDKYGMILANTAREKGSGLSLDQLEDVMKLQW